MDVKTLELPAGSSVLLLWGGNTAPDQLTNTVNDLKTQVGQEGRVQVEHAERLLMCKY